MKDAQNPIVAATALSQRLIVRQWKPLFAIFILTCLVSLQLTDSLLAAGQGDDGTRWMLQLSMGLYELAEGVFVFLILSWGIPHVHDVKAAALENQPFAEPYLNSFFAEYMRFMAYCLIGTLFVLIPGIVAYCLLVFVPYIAIFSKPYRNDEVSAVQYSVGLAKKCWPLILAGFAGTTVVQLLLEFLPHIVTELYTLPVRVLFLALGLLTGIWSYSFMFTLFERAVRQENEFTHL